MLKTVSSTFNVSQIVGTLPTTNGGTGQSSWTAGDLPFYASGTALSKLGIGAANQIEVLRFPAGSFFSGAASGATTVYLTPGEGL